MVKHEENLSEIVFRSVDGRLFSQRHDQDCCEAVYIEDVTGDLQDLVGSPITMADESFSSDLPPPEARFTDESSTWSFYRIATAKGYVTIRWYGTSNGYYSETASLYENKSEG